MYLLRRPEKLPLLGTYLNVRKRPGVGGSGGEYSPLNDFVFLWQTYTFIADTHEVLSRIGFCEAVGTLACCEPLKVSDGLDVSGGLDNSHTVKAWTIPVPTLGSYEHAATIGRYFLDSTIERPHGLGIKEVVVAITAVTLKLIHSPEVGHSRFVHRYLRSSGESRLVKLLGFYRELRQ